MKFTNEQYTIFMNDVYSLMDVAMLFHANFKRTQNSDFVNLTRKGMNKINAHLPTLDPFIRFGVEMALDLEYSDFTKICNNLLEHSALDEFETCRKKMNIALLQLLYNSKIRVMYHTMLTFVSLDQIERLQEIEQSFPFKKYNLNNFDF